MGIERMSWEQAKVVCLEAALRSDSLVLVVANLSDRKNSKKFIQEVIGMIPKDSIAYVRGEAVPPMEKIHSVFYSRSTPERMAGWIPYTDNGEFLSINISAPIEKSDLKNICDEYLLCSLTTRMIDIEADSRD